LTIFYKQRNEPLSKKHELPLVLATIVISAMASAVFCSTNNDSESNQSGGDDDNRHDKLLSSSPVQGLCAVVQCVSMKNACMKESAQ